MRLGSFARSLPTASFLSVHIYLSLSLSVCVISCRPCPNCLNGGAGGKGVVGRGGGMKEGGGRDEGGD